LQRTPNTEKLSTGDASRVSLKTINSPNVKCSHIAKLRFANV